MPQSSTYLTVLTSVQSVIQALGLTDWNGTAVPSIVRKTAAYRFQVDTANPRVIYVSRNRRGPRVEPKIFGDRVWIWYPVTISTVAAGNQDLNNHIDYYLNWQQLLRESFQAPTLSGATNVFDSNIDESPMLDDRSIKQNFDTMLLTVSFKAWETRGTS